MKTNEITITVAGLPNTCKGMIASLIAHSLREFGMSVSIYNESRDTPVEKEFNVEIAKDYLKSIQIMGTPKFKVDIKQDHLSKNGEVFKFDELKK